MPGLAAKPIVDILPVVRDIERIDALNDLLLAAGYTPKGENGIPGRRYLQQGCDRRAPCTCPRLRGRPS
ncbi:MAG: GrpB family protein [Anaerolineae bacterium]